MPMVKFIPSDEQREVVAALSAAKMPLEKIASSIINPRTKRAISVKTLGRMFKEQLTSGVAAVVEAYRGLKAALEAGLTPIVCVGEVLQEREAGLTEDVLRRQCARAFHKISTKKAGKMVVAYEPVWAIGTGKTATPQLASEAHSLIRGEAAKTFGQEFADQLRILYGGSVKPENAKALMSESEIDGALVGGASLDPKSFASIVKY